MFLYFVALSLSPRLRKEEVSGGRREGRGEEERRKEREEVPVGKVSSGKEAKMKIHLVPKKGSVLIIFPQITAIRLPIISNPV